MKTVFRLPWASLCASLLACLMLAACTNLGGQRVLKLAHTHDVTHPVHEAIVFMGKRLEEKSGGKMSIKIFTAAQLGQEREVVELLQIGSVAMTKVSSSVMENFVPEYRALSFPFVFGNQQHQFKVLDGPIGQRLLLGAEKYFVRGLCFYDAGSRSFYTKEKPVQSPDDLAGLKIRVMKSNTAMNMVTALGGSPTPISYGELYTALQGGVVDGAENNAPSLLSSRHFEVCKYYSIDEHTTVPDVLLISKVVWESLKPQEQKWLQEAVQESIGYQRQRWAEADKAAMEALRKAGVQINYPEKAPFEQKVSAMYEAVRQNDPALYRLLEEIKQVQ